MYLKTSAGKILKQARLPKQYKVNSQITTPQVRLIGEDGKQIGILSRDQALDYALGQGADLVLVGERVAPPIAKIVDYNKFLYQENKREAEARKKQKVSGLKELRLGSPFAGQADVEARIKRGRQLLAQGYKVRFVVKFLGRQITHPEFGYRTLEQVAGSLGDVAKIERVAKFEGKLLVMVFAPNK